LILLTRYLDVTINGYLRRIYEFDLIYFFFLFVVCPKSWKNGIEIDRYDA